MRERFESVAASRWFDPGLAVALTAACLVEVLARPELRDSPRAAIASLLVGATVAVRRTYAVAAACAAAAVLVANYDQSANPPIAAIAIGLVLSYSCGAHAARRPGLIGVVALMVGSQVNMGFSEFPNVEIAFTTLGPWWIGLQLRKRRELVAALAQRTAELEAEQDAFARLSVRRERARIARELHDVVAHHLAVIVVQAGAGRMAPIEQTDAAAERFAAIRHSGDQALAEMAKLVDILHADAGESPSGLGRLRVLIDAAGAGGVAVRFTPPRTDVPLPSEAGDAAYHVVQEALTNAIKHAPGAEIQVRLALDDGALEVHVRNGGAGAPSALAATGSGMGLDGMRERIEALGGVLDAGPEPDGGWAVSARLPLAATALTAA